ncbi:MAG: hypothetical protein M3Y08_02990 [Fibrobacterota bacterium]|nr:hypothetical protein [Fibrobacterota bacterium]
MILISVLIPIGQSESLEFSRPEWTDPGQPGSSVWLKNETSNPIRIESLFLRNDGFQTSDEVALSLGRKKYFFAAEKGKAGKWTRLIPRKGDRKIRLRANDSLLVAGFEYGNRLKAKRPRKILAEEYVLDLKWIDNAGDSAVVKVSQSAPAYIIKEAPDGSTFAPMPERSSRTGLSEGLD